AVRAATPRSPSSIERTISRHRDPSVEDTVEILNARQSPPVSSRRRRAQLGFGLLLLAVVAGAYWLKTSNMQSPTAPVDVGEAAMMKAGLDALYTRNDPTAASIQFRGVLAQDPEHYGATYQLGVALDRAGRQAEARAHWERMLVLAKAAHDERTIATVVARLERVDVVSDQAIMQRGLDALYRAGDARAAAAEFTTV